MERGRADREMVQRGTIAFSAGLLVADGLLPQGAGEAYEQRSRKTAETQHRRRERNLSLRQPTLPLETPEGVTNQPSEMFHCG